MSKIFEKYNNNIAIIKLIKGMNTVELLLFGRGFVEILNSLFPSFIFSYSRHFWFERNGPPGKTLVGKCYEISLLYCPDLVCW